MAEPVVSFIVPVYKVAAYLPACVDSILAQQGTSFEVILVDDGSPDNSGQVCDDYAEKDARVRVIHQENAGVSAARNAGLDAARGQWVCFVDGDDWLAPDFLAVFCSCLAGRPDLEICFVRHVLVKDGALPPAVEPEPQVLLDRADFYWLLHGGVNRDLKGHRDYWTIKPATPCKFYLRRLIRQVGAQFPVGVPTGEDLLFNLRLFAAAQSGAYLSDTVYYYRQRATSVTQALNPHAVQDYNLLQAKLEAFFAARPDGADFRADLDCRAVLHLGFCCMLQFCHPDNPAPYAQRRQAFLQAAGSEPFRTALQRAPAGAFRIQKRVLLFFMKRRCFSAVSLLCWAQRKR